MTKGGQWASEDVWVNSLAGWMALGTFMEARSICPDAFQCEDAQAATIMFTVVTLIAATIWAAAWWAIRASSKKVGA